MAKLVWQSTVNPRYAIVDTGEKGYMYASCMVENIGTSYAKYQILGMHHSFRKADFAVDSYASGKAKMMEGMSDDNVWHYF